MAGSVNTQTLLRNKSSEAVSFTATSAQSSAAAAGIRAVRLVATQDCYYLIGINPTATTSSAFLPANVVEYKPVFDGEKVAVLREDTDGTLNVAWQTS